MRVDLGEENQIGGAMERPLCNHTALQNFWQCLVDGDLSMLRLRQQLTAMTRLLVCVDELKKGEKPSNGSGKRVEMQEPALDVGF